ncbi:GxxExxY protein [Treponema berlinense]|uniref:GxxExxY protein n=1 Tax=Treponema berlinense TaxID=225004 RepID=UPI0026F0BE25|nr:GxxExxY protein [Treponema berlinense]
MEKVKNKINSVLRSKTQIRVIKNKSIGELVMLQFEEQTEKIINACMEVHNELKNGFLEPVYQEALEKN